MELEKFDEIKYKKFKGVDPILTQAGRVEAFLKFPCHLKKKWLLSTTHH